MLLCKLRIVGTKEKDLLLVSHSTLTTLIVPSHQFPLHSFKIQSEGQDGNPSTPSPWSLEDSSQKGGRITPIDMKGTSGFPNIYKPTSYVTKYVNRPLLTVLNVRLRFTLDICYKLFCRHSQDSSLSSATS